MDRTYHPAVAGPTTPVVATNSWRHRVDPEGRAWRNAVRGVACSVPLFAVYATVGFTTWAPWAFIGTLNTLFPDIGGPKGPRVRTAAQLLVGSAIAVFLGAVAADSAPVLVVSMFVVAFAAAFVGVCSPYLAAAGTSILLVFLLSAGTPTDASEAGWRAVNVIIGCALAAAAIIWLAPAPPRRRTEPALAQACRAIADLIEPSPGPTHGDDASSTATLAGDGDEPRDELEQAATTAVGAMVAAVTAQRWPPLSRHPVDRARLAFAHDLQSLYTRGVAIHRADRAGSARDQGRVERQTTATALRALAAWLVDDGPGPDGTAVRTAREHTEAVELATRAIAEERVGDPDAFDRFRMARSVAAACRLTAIITDGVDAAAFHLERPRLVGPDGLVDVTGGLPSYPQRLRLNLSPRSMTFRHAIRLATACAVTVGTYRALGLPHGYWAVLTVVVTLRTNRGASTRRSADRLLGTVAGLTVAAVTIAVAEASGARVAIIETMTVITLAATLWTGAARVRWAWAVMAVTACVLTLFQLEQPGDWSLERERLVATILGLGAALGVAFVLWPSTSVDALRRAVTSAGEAIADHLDAVRGAVTGREADASLEDRRRRAHRRMAQARSTLGASVRDEMVQPESALVPLVLELEQAAELVRRADASSTGTFRTPPGPATAAAFDGSAGALADDLRRAVGPGSDTGPTATDDVVLTRWRALSSADPVPPALLDAMADLTALSHRVADVAELSARDAAARVGSTEGVNGA